MKILAFDQASSISGVAIFENDKLSKYDLIDLHKIKDAKLRVSKMIQDFISNITNEKPDYVVFEDVSLQTNASTLILLSQLQGTIIGICTLYNIPYTILKPTTWRKALLFKQGRDVKRPELKKQAKDFVRNKYNLELKDDICDAICIGEAFIVMNNKEK